MKIKFLGTAAAEAYPAMFCDCENCKKAESLGGKNIRTRSQALIENDMLIDFPSILIFTWFRIKLIYWISNPVLLLTLIATIFI